MIFILFVFNVGNIRMFQSCLYINFQSLLNIWYMMFQTFFFSFQKLYRIQIISICIRFTIVHHRNIEFIYNIIIII